MMYMIYMDIFLDTPNGAQGIFLALHGEITPFGVRGTIWNSGIKRGSAT